LDAIVMRAILFVIPLSFGLIACNQRPTPSQADAVPPKFTSEQLTQSLTLIAREAEKGKERFAALDAVSNSAPYVSEFVQSFPNAKVSYRYFSSSDQPGFDVGVDLYDRYQFGMQLPVHFDTERRRVIGYGKPKFIIREVASVTRGSNGIAEVSYVSTGERHFGSADWQTLVAHGGDFAAIGYLMRTNQPVTGFEQRNVQP